MAIEIERRWLVARERIPAAILQQPNYQQIQQGYLSQSGVLPVVRVRMVTVLGTRAALQTVKAAREAGSPGMEEIEFAIPLTACSNLLDLSLARLEKQRFCAPHSDGLLIELDLFTGNQWLDGLCIAELEVPSLDHPFEVPDWFGPEITGTRSLSNVALAYHPMQARQYADAVWAEHAAV